MLLVKEWRYGRVKRKINSGSVCWR
jgi:hypothetical protein